MKPLYRIILFIIICWFGYSAFRQTLEPKRNDVLFVLQHYNLIILFVLLIVAVVSDIKAYRSYSKLFQFYSSIAALFLCGIVALRLFTFSNIERSKTIFKALPTSGSRNITEIQFKEKDKLLMRDMRSQIPHIYYGQYFKNKDSIIITQTNFAEFSDSLPVSGVIRNNMIILNDRDTFLIDDPKN